MEKISWFSLNNLDESGELWYSQGFFNAGLNTIKALQQKGYGVFHNREELDYHVNFCSPLYYQLRNKYKVGYTPWESTKVPISWLYNMKQCDEIWATSNFVKEVYERNNVHTNIHVIPHGITEEWEITERQLSGRFNFLHVGGDSKRKNAQIVVDAFLELYDGDDDYRLVLKYNNFCHAEVYINGQLAPAYEHPQIIGIPEIFTVEDLVRLYHKCHCMVYPTSGEGFGMIPLESIATGLPTIVTNETGCKDYAHLGIPLSATPSKAHWHDHVYGADTGDWFVPNMDELIPLMQSVVDNYETIADCSFKSAKIAHADWSWSAVADRIISRYEEYKKIFI
jgi:glycosyltransferase involved in cell wall biosynthesis